ncbi:DUF4160 domain-containing protein [Oricola sp.]|uniref:DUF4160 domain-containing protein n=1 Tax=Oricola sp. TaxID=1979950 RepID=UPI0025E0B2B2|nr:DUF4160 domain-containing protein [Oricola sp.]MCI5073669.1 DUF4160 domain-containing protein [Oricola sp.]
MPTISIFFGIVIQMYWRDHNPPHLHAIYQGQEALFDLATGEVIGGALPRKAERIVSEWIDARRPALLDNWERGRLHQPFNQVPGADVE